MKKVTKLSVICLLLLLPTSIFSMPSANSGSSDVNTNTSEEKSDAIATSSTPSTQFKTIELEGISKKSIVSISKKEAIKEFSRLFDEAKKLHTEMLETLKGLEEMRINLIQSFRNASDKLDGILQEVSFKAGQSSTDIRIVTPKK